MKDQEKLQNIQHTIAQGELELAIEQLASVVQKTSFEEERVQISANYASLKKQSRLGIISAENQRIQRAQISAALLSLLSDVEKRENTAEASTEDTKPSNANVINIGGNVSNSGQFIIGNQNQIRIEKP